MKRFGNFHLLFLLVILAGMLSCNSDYTIRQRGYFKIDLPEHKYQSFNMEGYPYTFEYPVYANVIRDTTFFEDVPENPYWINLDFPGLNGRIYISYKDMKTNDFDKLVADAFKLTYKHTTKATAITDSLMRTREGLTGVFFRVGGNAATARQFFLTDTTTHFIRGALYFDATPNADSLGVVNDFLEEDMNHLINTLKFVK